MILPLAWPMLLTAAMGALPALGLPLTALIALVPTWNFSPDASLPVLVTGILLYLCRRRRRLQVAAFAAFHLLFYLVYVVLVYSQMPGFHWTQMFTVYYEWYGAFAGLLMLCYNGQRGRGCKNLFYAFYPAHIYIFYILSWALYRFLS